MQQVADISVKGYKNTDEYTVPGYNIDITIQEAQNEIYTLCMFTPIILYWMV